MKKQSKASKKKPAARKNGNQEQDIIKVLKADHEPLKKLIKVMKNSDKDMEERKSAFEEFAPLLTLHAKAEEKVLYTFLKEEADMKEEGFEGDVEHGLAEQMLDEAKRTEDEDLFSARIKVLAELVEHHIKEEEEDIFPEFKKNSEIEDRKELAVRFLEEKSKVQASEKEVRKANAKEHAAQMQ